MSHIAPKVSSMTSPRSGRDVANQFIIEMDGTVYFQSYRTIIAKYTSQKKINGNVSWYAETSVVLDPNWNYSRTTSKYLYRFLSTDRKQILANIKSGTYLVADLNN